MEHSCKLTIWEYTSLRFQYYLEVVIVPHWLFHRLPEKCLLEHSVWNVNSKWCSIITATCVLSLRNYHCHLWLSSWRYFPFLNGFKLTLILPIWFMNCVVTHARCLCYSLRSIKALDSCHCHIYIYISAQQQFSLIFQYILEIVTVIHW